MPPHLDSGDRRADGRHPPFPARATAVPFRHAVGQEMTEAPPSQSSIESATRGDPAAIEDVLRAYLPRLQRFVHLRLGPQLRAREETLDVVQSTVRELLEEPRFEWRGEIEFRAWLFSAALNKIREKGRFHGAGKRAAVREADPAPHPPLQEMLADMVTPSRIAMAKEELQRLEAAFVQLTEPQREVLTLARVVGLPHAMIAQHMGKSEVAVRQLLVRAMAALGSAMGPA
ncbi:MAG TPA: sigma-70 family RNA polymerase sigma factor [Planctomycetota bacterium]|nr:sigma-70 family RNA polymerase sigma factor [Planctomycetota bacterium]